MNKEGEGFEYLRQMFSKITDPRQRKEFFVGPNGSSTTGIA